MRFIFVILLCASMSVNADHHHHHSGWIAPLVGGIAAGAIIGGVYNSRPNYAPPTAVYPPYYGGVPYGYHYESIYDAYCGCYKTVLVAN